MCTKVFINIFAIIYSSVFKMHLIRTPTVFQQLICDFLSVNEYPEAQPDSLQESQFSQDVSN